MGWHFSDGNLVVKLGSDLDDKGQRMLEWAKELFPFNRSLTGSGVQQSLDVFERLIPDLRIHAVESGAAIFDWQVPPQWEVSEAFVQHIPSGERFAEFSDLNLHLVGYSEPVDLVMPRNELLRRVHSLPEQPDLVPYVTSYYERTWGFCMSENQKNRLPEGDYRVVIDSRIFPGQMLFADAVIEGQSSEEVFFSSYICHPSMANNELSGPVLLAAISEYIRDSFHKPKFTYRFALVPETIGSLTYLHHNMGSLKERVIAGFVLSCVGDNRAFSHIESRLGNSLADSALQAAFVNRANASTYSFLHRESDERQYCAPGVDLPVAGFCRSKYHSFPEYHTSADNFDVVTSEGLGQSFQLMREIVDSFETALYPQTAVIGEPQLSKRGLYPTLGQVAPMESSVKARLDVLAYSDGSHNIFDIARVTQTPLRETVEAIRELISFGLLESFNHSEQRRVEGLN